MKKYANIIFPAIFVAIAGALFAVTGQAVLAAIAVFIPIVCFMAWRSEQKKRKEDAIHPRPLLDDFIAQYGQPDDIIITDPTRAEEAEGAILVYHKEGTMVYNGQTINIKDIKDITFNNSALPYFASDFQIILTTTNPEMPLVRIFVGSDAVWAQQVVVAIKDTCSTGTSNDSEKSE